MRTEAYAADWPNLAGLDALEDFVRQEGESKGRRFANLQLVSIIGARNILEARVIIEQSGQLV
jgi:hypothetical protein